VGHSVTLALATLGVVRINAHMVEVLIPVTIVGASLAAIRASARPGVQASAWVQYCLAALFGLIHGLGFSTFLRSLLGSEESIVVPLFAFNVGLEIGQVAIVISVLLLGWLVERLFHLARREWVLILCGGTMGIALTMILDRLFTSA
jgi:hypothetical protein